jgi:hypothetical protein
MPWLRLHDLRHQYASMLVNSGRTLYEVQAILGHAIRRSPLAMRHLSTASSAGCGQPGLEGHQRGAGAGGLGSARRRQPPGAGTLPGAPEWPQAGRSRAGHGRGDGAAQSSLRLSIAAPKNTFCQTIKRIDMSIFNSVFSTIQSPIG